MNHPIDIFWPELAAPEIWEVQVSYAFCRKTSRRLCEPVLDITWMDYPSGWHIRQILAHAVSDMILIVTDPEVVLSPHAVDRLRKAVGAGHGICAPAYNLSGKSAQQAQLASPYLNVSTYLEISRQLSETAPVYRQALQPLDPACILCSRESLQILSRSGREDIPVQALGSSMVSSSVIDPGSLVHRFGNYFESERTDLVRLVPDRVKQILDIGCARGGYGKTLKQDRSGVFITGVEMNPVMAETAGRYYDEMITCPIEQAPIDRVYDLVNCGDLLEHLENPWRLLARIHELLAPEGYLVLSVPNAGHWTIVKDLLKGSFEYIPLGLLCIAHLRWFTETSIRQALADAGFSIDVFERQQLSPTPEGQKFIDGICAGGYGAETSLKTNEFIIRAVKR